MTQTLSKEILKHPEREQGDSEKGCPLQIDRGGSVSGEMVAEELQAMFRDEAKKRQQSIQAKQGEGKVGGNSVMLNSTSPADKGSSRNKVD